MNYLCIANAALIEHEALTLVGASTKRGDESIGMFGSGNKYALAYFLRNGYDIRIFSGADEIPIETVPTTLRGHDFNVIYIGHEKTSITTEMGHDWSLWQAIREIYANAMDDDLLYFDFVDEINPEPNATHFYIPVTNEVREFMFNIKDYFAVEKRVLFENETGRILEKHNNKTCIYRRGIRCYETENPSIFDYDLYNVDINEDRMVKHSWEIPEEIWKLLAACDNPKIPFQLLNEINNAEYVESDINSNLVFLPSEMSDAWKQPLQDKKVCPRTLSGYLDDDERPKTYIVPHRLYSKLSTLTENQSQPAAFNMVGTVAYKPIGQLDDHRAQQLSKVYDFFNDVGFKLDYRIEVVNFPEKNIHGTVDRENEKILIGRDIFEHGLHHVIVVVIEEYIHLKYSAYDETRKFQDSIINEFVSYMANKSNVEIG